MRIPLALMLVLALGACSSKKPPATHASQTVNYGPATAPPQPPAPSRPIRMQNPAPARAPTRAAPAYAGPFRWHTRLADAQAQARREGKLLLISSTRPGCGLCKKFRDKIVPEAAAQVNAVAVGYMVETANQESPQVWQILKANLPRAGLMPLVGILTPDLRWLTGFGGPPSTSKLLNALNTARRLYPVSARIGSELEGQGPATAQVNEYGEVEWTPLDDLWPGRRETHEGMLAADGSSPASPPAAGPAAATPPMTVPSAVAAAPGPPVPVPAMTTTPAAPRPRAIASAPAQPASPAAAPDEPTTRAWAQQALRQALEEIRRGEFEAAKRTLAEIDARLPGSPLAREAGKGAVAIYNAERIATAQGRERERFRESARQNLGATMWGPLFS
ncbi:MAG: hypothetical protein ACC662_05925 [Planctomycetota bacterium]